MNIRTSITFFICLCLMFLSFIIFEYQTVLHLVYYRLAVGDYYNPIINLLSFFLLFLSVVTFSAIASRWVNLLFWTLLFVGGVMGKSYFLSTNSFLTYSDFLWLMSESKSFSVTFQALAPIYAKVLLSFAFMFSAFYFFRLKFKRKLSFKLNLVVWIGVVLVFLTIRDGFFTLSLKTMLGKYIYSKPLPPRNPVDIKPQIPGVKNIILLVDESVTYQHFISLAEQEKIPVDQSKVMKGYSSSNCSAYSQALIRWGFQPSTLTKKTSILTNPTLWSYAKAAGYATYHIDGQMTSRPQNFINATELAEIDHFIPSEQGIETDKNIAAELVKLSKLEGNKLIVVTLKGVHYMYTSNLPKTYEAGGKNVEQIYMDALVYNKRDFFKTLSDIYSEDNMIIYTSDHGQKIVDGVIPHCTADMDILQYEVPIVLLSTSEQFKSPEQGVFSHSQIFPTVLYGMGYPENEVSTKYDNALNKSSEKIILFYKNPFNNEGADLDYKEYLPQ